MGVGCKEREMPLLVSKQKTEQLLRFLLTN